MRRPALLPRVPRLALGLGLAWLVPLYGLALALWFGSTDTVLSTAWVALLGYAAVSIAFLGAVHWGLALRMLDIGGPTPPVLRQLAFSVAPALAAWLSLLLAPPWVLAVPIALFPVTFLQDRRAVARGLAPDWYLDLRLPQTLLAEPPLIAALVRLLGLP